MMISPESYYNGIKDKSKEEILTEIRSLKREINQLKKVLEDPYYLRTIFPGESTQLSCSQMYLNKAKLAYAQAGGTYKPTKAEKREVEFNKKLDNLIKVRFGYEDDRGIIFYYIIELKDELESYIKTGNKNFGISLWHNEQQISSKELLIDILKNLDMSQWRRRYSMTDFGYPETDGSYWHLRLEFDNGYRSITFSGNGVQPYNFYEILELFGIED